MLLPPLVCLLCILGLSALWAQEYRLAAFESVSALYGTLAEEYPEAEGAALSSLKIFLEGQDSRDNAEYSGAYLTQYGYTDRDFSGRTPRKLFFFTILASALSALTPFFLFCHQRGYDRERIRELTQYLEHLNSGQPAALIQTQEDAFSRLQDEIGKTVTELYRTREAALLAKENFAEHLANIAHQLKTPLTASFLSLELMKESAPSPHAGQIERQLKRLNRLEEALLTLSRIDSGALQLENTPVDICTALTLAAENLDDLLQKEHIQVSIPNRENITICGDLEWTMEAFMNLIKNCMEHSRAGQTIHCDYSSGPLYTEILIWDEGQGFAEEDLPRLFDRFYRGKYTSGDGTGIGLSLARSIIELENGVITARNLPRGGACFEIRFYCHQNVTSPCYDDVN